MPGHGGGQPARYTSAERERILAEARRPPERERDGTATWSLVTLQRALRRAPDGLPQVSTYTIWCVLHRRRLELAAHAHLVPDRHRRAEAQAGPRAGARPRRRRKKGLIEQAYREAEAGGVALACQDEAGPYQTVPDGGTPPGRPPGTPPTSPTSTCAWARPSC